jgi:filamentous hemagglutinin family protein
MNGPDRTVPYGNSLHHRIAPGERGGGLIASEYKAQTVHPVGFVRRTRSALLVGTAFQAAAILVLALPAEAQPAPNAHPTGGVVVGGAVMISQTASNTAVHQSSTRGAVNWQSFNVGSQQSVTFQQPNAQAVILNTVTGPNPSQIAGRIDANGQVVLVNQSGVTFYKGSQVNTAGLMVSASGANPAQFMAGGNVSFDQAGNPNAHVVNNGNITIKGAGLAALVAPGVANAGTISAHLGHVVLAGAKTAMLDLYGDKLVSVIVTGSVAQTPDGADALVTNTGVIRANGGTVQLTAKAVDGVVTDLVSAGGKIEANTVGANQGRILIDGIGGSIMITGNLSATGKVAGTTGGEIGLQATDAVIVKSGAVVNASGAAGGGTVAVGTTLKRARGGPAVTGEKMAKGVLVEQGATIAADASVNGNGGRVTVLSSEVTAMDGAISAKGGQAGGNGGFIEVSGFGGYSLTGSVDVSAPVGALGTITIDPTNLTIVPGAIGAGDQDRVLMAGLGTLLATAPDIGNDAISNGEINSLTGNILLQATNNLTVSAPITLTGAGQSLTLQAGNNLIVGAPIATAGSITFSAADQTIAGFNAAGALTLNNAVTTTGPQLSLSAGTGGITVNANASAAGLISMSSSGGINLNGPASLPVGVVNTAEEQQITANSVNFSAAGNVTQTGYVAVTGTQIQLVAGGFIQNGPSDLAVPATENGAVGGAILGSVMAASGVEIAVSGGVSQSGFSRISVGVGGVLTVATQGNVVQSGYASIFGDNVSFAIGNNGALQQSGNALITTVAGGTVLSVSIDAPGGIVQAGSGFIGAGNLISISAGPVTQSGGMIVTPGTLEISGTSVSLSGANSVGTLAAGTATAGSFLLNDGTSLTVGGPINATGNVSITANGSLNLVGSVTGTQVGLTATGGALTESGGVINAGTLSASGNAVSLPGANNIGTLATSSASDGNFALSNVGTIIIAGPISVSAGNTLTLIDDAPEFLPGGSLIAVGGTVDVQPYSTNATFTVGGGGASRITANTLSIGSASTGTLIIFGPLDVPNVSTVDLQSGGDITLTSTASINVGSPNAANASTLNMQSGSAVSEASAASINVGTLTAAGTSVSLAGANSIGTLAAGTATGGSFLLNDGSSLTVGGPISATGNVNITANGSLNLVGSVTGTQVGLTAIGGALIESGGVVNAGTLTASGNAISLVGANNIGTLAASSASDGNFALSNIGTIVVAGQISASPGNTLTLIDDAPEFLLSGSLIAVGGTVDVQPYSPNATFTVGGGGASQIIANTLSIGSASTGTLTIYGPLDVANVATVDLQSGGAITLTSAASINIGSPNAANASTLNMQSGGAISEALAASINVGTLTASGTSVSLNGANSIGTVAAASASNGNFALSSVGPLTITGPVSATGALAVADMYTITLSGKLSAPRITMDNGNGTINVLNGTSILTGGVNRPSFLTSNNLPSETSGSDGFYVATGLFTQNGTMQVPSQRSIVEIDATRGIQFAASGSLGLMAPNSWLVLELSNGAKATGNIEVGALDVVYLPQGSGTMLTGSVGGFGGPAAAGVSHIEPVGNSNFLLNGCPIGSYSCGISIVPVPNVFATSQLAVIAGASGATKGGVNYQLGAFVLGSIFYPSDQSDLLLPLVTDLEY